MRLTDFFEIVDQLPRNVRGCKIWQGALYGGGYPQVNIKGTTISGNRLVLTRSLGRDIAPGLLALHHCDIPSCVEQEHIYEGTYADNTRDILARGGFNNLTGENWKLAHGATHSRGSLHYRASFKDDEVQLIRRLHREGWRLKQIADLLGANRVTVSDIIRNRTWKHVKELAT